MFQPRQKDTIIQYLCSNPFLSGTASSTIKIVRILQRPTALSHLKISQT